MKFGIFDHLDKRGEPLGRFYDDRIAFARAVEAAGFHSYHVAEHHGTPLGLAPSPNLFLAALARETTRLRFGPMVYLLPLYHPVRLIEEVCMLDQLSGGRLDMGVGRGISPWEIGFYGIETAKSRAMFEEGLEVLLKGLTGARLDHHGAWYDIADMPMELAPAQRPYPPLWYGGANEEGVRFAARYGMNFATLGGNDRVKPLIRSYAKAWDDTRDAQVRAASPVAAPFIGIGRHVVVAATDAEADRLARPAYAHWFASVAKLWRDHGGNPITGMLIADYDEAVQVGAVVAGAPATVTAKLAGQARDIGFNYLICQVAFGSLGHAEEMRSLSLFASEVMPALKGL
jgi:alkanesulfonate monooxygenase SsuD/methylene tetrahydromethanopterin reductase-like flavin-dependent oxidoreductase (luciferase family)